MEIPRYPEIEKLYAEIADRTDEEITVIQGSYREAGGVQIFMEQGMRAMPFLLEQIARLSEHEAFTWRGQVIGTVAFMHGQQIPSFAKEDGQEQSIQEAMVHWGVKQGFIKAQTDGL